MRHTEQAIRQMQEALDHARIADTAYTGGLRRAVLFALFIPEVIGNADSEHRAWCEARLAELKGGLREEWDQQVGTGLVGGYATGPSREDFWLSIANALKLPVATP